MPKPKTHSKQSSAKKPRASRASSEANTQAKTATKTKPKSGGLVITPIEEAPEPTPPTHEQIAAKAHEIWQAKGRPIGQDDANWAEAEAALR